MPETKSTNQTRKACNLSLDRQLVKEARSLGLAISRAAEAGITEAIRQKKREDWLEANTPALKSSNAWVEANGLPLARHRQF